MIENETIILSETRRTIDLTLHSDNLQYSNANPGGYGAVTFDLSRDINADEFEPFAYVAVYNSTTGEQVGGGRLSNPGRGFNDRGDAVWKMSALGEGLASTQERKVPYFLIDSRLDSFKNGASTSVNRTWAVGEAPHPDREDGGLVFTINQTSIGHDAYSNANFYEVNQYPGQRIGSVSARHRAGRDSSGFDLEWQLRGPNIDFLVHNWDRTERTNAREIGTHWVSTHSSRLFNFVIVRDGGTHTVDTSVDYYTIKEASIASVRLDRFGNEIIGGGAYTRGNTGAMIYVLAHEAIIDALARFCPRIDVASADIAEGSFTHVQLVWSDGVNVHDVLQYLMSVESTFTWAVYERLGNNKWRFEYRDTVTQEPRYVVGEESLVSFEFTGGDEEELVEFHYTGQDALGTFRTRGVELPNPQFGRLDIHPTDTESITLESLGGWDWINTAELLGISQIVASRFRAIACRATVEGKVFDRIKNRWVNVSQMEPGWVVMIPPVAATRRQRDSGELEWSGGFLQRMDYNAQSKQASIEINSPTVDEMRALAAMMSGRRDV